MCDGALERNKPMGPNQIVFRATVAELFLTAFLFERVPLLIDA